MKLTYAQIIAQHQTLQKTEAAPIAPERVEQVKAFIADVVAAGTDIADPRQREQLRSILRYWSAWVYERTKEFPPSQLVPFSGTGAEGPPVRPVGLTLWLIAGLALVVILIGIYVFIIRPAQTAALLAPTLAAINAQNTQVALEMTVTSAAPIPSATLAVILATPTAPPTSSPTWTPTPSVTPTHTPGPSPTSTATQPPHALWKLPQAEGAVFSVDFSPDGRWLAAGGGNGVITFWDLSGTGEPSIVATLTPGASVFNLEFSPDGAYFAAGLLDHTARVWPLASSSQTQLGEIVQAKLETVLPGHASSVTSSTFSPDGTLLATGSTDGTIRIWDVGSWSQFNSPPETFPLINVLFSPDGRLLAYAGTGSKILIWDFAQEKIVATLQGPSKAGRSLAISPDGLVLIAGSYNGSVHLWKRSSAETLDFVKAAQPLEASGAGYALAFSLTGMLAVAKEDGSIDLWDVVVDTPRLITSFTGQHTETVRALSFNPDGSLLASGGNDQSVVLWATR